MTAPRTIESASFVRWILGISGGLSVAGILTAATIASSINSRLSSLEVRQELTGAMTIYRLDKMDSRLDNMDKKLGSIENRVNKQQNGD